MKVPSPSAGPSPAAWIAAAMRVDSACSSASACSCSETAVPSAAFSACARAGGGVACALLLRGELVELVLLLRGRGAARRRRPPSGRRPSCCCASSWSCNFVTRRASPWRLSDTRFEVVLALDELPRAVGRAEQARSCRRRRAAGTAAPRCAARRHAPPASFFCVTSTFACRTSAVEPEAVDLAPAPRRAARWRRSGGSTRRRGTTSSRCRSACASTSCARADCSAALASLICCWSCCCLSDCCTHRATGERDGREGHEHERGEGAVPAHGPHRRKQHQPHWQHCHSSTGPGDER